MIGTQDVYPAKFFPFDNREVIGTSWSPTNKKAQYIDKSVEVVGAIIEDWKLKYPFNDEHREVIDSATEFEAENPVTDFAYYKLDNVPFKSTTDDDVADDGSVISSTSKPEVLIDTIFISLNTLACQTSNSALYDTANDPGEQLDWLEEQLTTAR